MSPTDTELDTIAMVRAWKAREEEALEVLLGAADQEDVIGSLLSLVERVDELLPTGALERLLAAWQATALARTIEETQS